MKSVTVDLAGPPCPRCGRAMEVREHGRLHKKHPRQLFYYSRWYRCAHADCRTTLVMPPAFIRWNHNPAAEQQRRLKAIREQLGPHGEGGAL
jgi:hypothetical protein